MPLYECTFICRQDLTRADVTRVTDDYSKLIADNGGKVVNQEYWGLRNLAYDINKSRRGHYTMLHLDAPADALKEMERVMRLSEEVVRTLTVRVDAFEEGPSAVLRAQNNDAEAA